MSGRYDGRWIVYDVRSDPAGSRFDGTCVFSPDGGRIAYVREMGGSAGRFTQVLVVEAG